MERIWTDSSNKLPGGWRLTEETGCSCFFFHASYFATQKHRALLSSAWDSLDGYTKTPDVVVSCSRNINSSVLLLVLCIVTKPSRKYLIQHLKTVETLRWPETRLQLGGCETMQSFSNWAEWGQLKLNEEKRNPMTANMLVVLAGGGIRSHMGHSACCRTHEFSAS